MDEKAVESDGTTALGSLVSLGLRKWDGSQPFFNSFPPSSGRSWGFSGFILTHVYNMMSACIADQILVERASQILRATLARSAFSPASQSRFRRMRLPLDATHWQYKLQEVESQA